MNDYLIAVIQGVVEGLTEFLPVSSTGHLVLMGEAISFTGSRAETFNVFIQLGAILAVVYLYLPRFTGLLDFSAEGEGRGLKGKEGLLKIGLACTPFLIVGAAFHKQIKALLFHPMPVAIALIVGGVALIAIEGLSPPTRVKRVEDLSLRDALVVGLFQCLALWPGMSRAGSTMIGALLFGFDRRVAAEFSFLVAVPVMCAAVGGDMLDSLHHLSPSDFPLFATGFVVSFLVAIIAVKTFIALLGRFTLRPFGAYRIALGALVLWLLS